MLAREIRHVGRAGIVGRRRNDHFVEHNNLRIVPAAREPVSAKKRTYVLLSASKIPWPSSPASFGPICCARSRLRFVAAASRASIAATGTLATVDRPCVPCDAAYSSSLRMSTRAMQRPWTSLKPVVAGAAPRPAFGASYAAEAAARRKDAGSAPARPVSSTTTSRAWSYAQRRPTTASSCAS